jgi:hypothetical protein
MRRSRERRKREVVWLQIELRLSEVNELMRRRFLTGADRHDKGAITRALYAFFDQTFRRTP